MKHADPRLLQQARQETIKKTQDLYQARAKHKNMKRIFRGIYSYPTRKLLFKVGQHGQ